MVVVRVLKDFRDRDSWAVVHKEGDLFSVDDHRGAELIALGLAEAAIAPESSTVPAEASEPVARRTKRRK